MNTSHLTDQQIQLFVFQQGNEFEPWATHMATCKECQLKATLYRSVLEEVANLEKPVFNIDLASQVISQLEPIKPSIDFSRTLVGFIVLVLVSWLGSIVYWTSHELASLFTRLSSMATYLILLTSSSLLIFLVISLYQEFLDKMKRLTLS
ncbi:hypothetical protein GO730_19620 [Spirosoma sp. HMF3257]|uniref:Zf-HC2 domain-containing protein n=1 Tax=Spirosoma telluris TaxID=2183553 RepID=A0A327NN42_9BACT|nr:hypothetical protein [Spirosoma telluris]RAI75809.1 hypothetical protein HMF3257_19550 [Spirosoma telluris]